MAPPTQELTIESIAAGGDGVARTEGLVVFVPRTAPGDVIAAHVEQRGRFARGVPERVLQASAVRVEPPCPHYTRDDCGGCQLQHIAYAAQLEAKRVIIRDAITRIARRDIELPVVHPSSLEWRYRRKLTLALRWQRGRWIAGLHPWHDAAAVFALEDCPITQEPVVAMWREILAASSHFPRVPELRGAVRLLASSASFVLEGGDAWPGARRFFEAVTGLSALWWQPEGHRRRLIAERGDGGDEASRDSASFVQVNEPVSAAVRAEVVGRVGAHLARITTATAPQVVDAYAGTGDTTVMLERAGATVTAIELDGDAARRAHARLTPPSRVLRGTVEERLPEALPADVVVLNPPRTGVDARVTETLASATRAPRAVIYVSCNPSTLARDISRLPGYRIAALTGYDMFPQTAHVETVCELVPTGEAA